ncbi:MAG: PEGA domain-containing protein [Halomonadaceae bacterium]|nr:MAG: PEGA domain-containing protein [Halomonadaceae bacterium]
MVDPRPLLFANALLLMLVVTVGFAGVRGHLPASPPLPDHAWLAPVNERLERLRLTSSLKRLPAPTSTTQQDRQSQSHQSAAKEKEEALPQADISPPIELITIPAITAAPDQPDTADHHEPLVSSPGTPDLQPGAKPEHAGQNGQPTATREALLRVAANVAGARITINGKSHGVGEQTLQLKPGSYTVEVSKPGHAPWRQQVRLGPGDDQSLSARLQRYTTVHFYQGEWEHGVVSGEGTYQDDNGLHYEGGFREQAFHGEGKAQWADGRRYKGEWADGEKEGYGELHRTDGSIYRGEFRNNQFHGRGTLSMVSGDSYTGNWSRGRFHGEGVLNYLDGTLYVGNFHQGRFHGQGTLTYADGRVYEGEFAEDRYHGQGRKLFTNGRRYTGEFANGRFHGPGTLNHPNGGSISSTFREGKAHGQVRLTTPKGERFTARTSEPGVCYREESYRATQCPPMDGW